MIDLPINLGLAGAFQTGLKYAYEKGYQYAIQFDADGQHRPEHRHPLPLRDSKDRYSSESDELSFISKIPKTKSAKYRDEGRSPQGVSSLVISMQNMIKY